MAAAADHSQGPPVDKPPPDSSLLLAGEDTDDEETIAPFANPCLEFFFVDLDTPPQRLRHLLAAAWDLDPLTALKLVCNLRGVRDTGKGDREGFYTAALWMHHHHPKTLAANLSALAEFGYIKDFPELLYRIVHGADVRKIAKAEAKEAPLARLAGRKRRRSDDPAPTSTSTGPSSKPGATKTTEEEATEGVVDSKPEATACMEVDQNVATKKGNISKKAQKAVDLKKLARGMYENDANYRALFDSVADFFADRLRSDLQLLQAEKQNKIGLAAKWCPSPDSSYDRATLLCEAIARRLFPRNSDPDYADLSDEHYSYRVLHRLRRDVLVRLRKALELPELYMSSQRWSELPYERVASVAMSRYELVFKRHDEQRFTAYLADVEAGKANRAGGPKPKTAAGAPLLLHEIVVGLGRSGNVKKKAVEQWNSLVEDLRAKGSLRNCIAVCDVSDEGLGTSPGAKLRKVCVALGLLISELSVEPWHNRVHAFSKSSANYCLPGVSGRRYGQKLKFILEVKENCDAIFSLRKVFEWILETAHVIKVEPKDMVKTIFVFTHREFDEASGLPCRMVIGADLDDPESRPWRDQYELLCEKFRGSEFKDTMPQVVFWKMMGRRSAALTSTKDGVLRLSGYSDDLMKLFLEKSGIVEPDDEMHAAIAGEEYQMLKVVD